MNKERRADNAKNTVNLDIQKYGPKPAQDLLGGDERVCVNDAKTTRQSGNRGVGLRSL